MTVNAINGSLLSALSAVDGATLSTLSAINGQTLVPSGSPNASDIIVTANAEFESGASDIFTSFSGGIASGVTGANGRVYDHSTFAAAFNYPGGQEEFVSAGSRFRLRTDADDGFIVFRRVSGAANHVTLGRTSGTFRVTSTANATTYTGTATISTLTWYYGTLYVRIHDTLGEFTAKLFDASGTLLDTITRTGIDTRNGTDLAELTVWTGVSADVHHDECWTDITGTFRGCGRIEVLSPNATGDLTQWSRGGTDSGNNWDQLNELPRDTTSHTFSTAADQYDLFNFANRSITGDLIGVQQLIYARAHTAGTRVYRPVCKVGGTIYEHSGGDITLTSTTTRIDVISWMNNPATGNAWTDSDLDGAQFGAKSVTTDVRFETMALHCLIDIS
jgi:hypothetical protein